MYHLPFHSIHADNKLPFRCRIQAFVYLQAADMVIWFYLLAHLQVKVASARGRSVF